MRLAKVAFDSVVDRCRGSNLDARPGHVEEQVGAEKLLVPVRDSYLDTRRIRRALKPAPPAKAEGAIIARSLARQKINARNTFAKRGLEVETPVSGNGVGGPDRELGTFPGCVNGVTRRGCRDAASTRDARRLRLENILEQLRTARTHYGGEDDYGQVGAFHVTAPSEPKVPLAKDCP